MEKKRAYQPFIIKKVDTIIGLLDGDGFFKENGLRGTEFAKTYLCDKLTEKFIAGELSDDDAAICSEAEMESFLVEIIIGTTLEQLIEKGYVQSYEDDGVEELFFLTEKGLKFGEEAGLIPLKDKKEE